MSRRLGIIDWGIGGISIYKQVKERLGDIPITYLSDTGATPYGRMTRRELVSRLNAVIKYLGALGVTDLAVGCNSASTAIPFVDPRGLRIVGVIEPAARLAARQRPRSLGLIGGRRTVMSGAYRDAFRNGRTVLKQRVAQPLSALIESGDVNSQTLRNECRRIMRPLRNCSHVLLACTHYPAIESVLKEYVSPATKFIDPSSAVTDKIVEFELERGGDDVILTTGDPRAMKKAAKAAFGVELRNIKRVRI